MKPSDIKRYFNKTNVVAEYALAAQAIGLWASEKKIFKQAFPRKDQPLLDLGCGTGRIAFGLWNLGYQHLTAVDFSTNMIATAKHINLSYSANITFKVGDATNLHFDENAFSGVIFGFNGLMQIPKRSRRLQAIGHIFRVLQPNGFFVFTTHDRNADDSFKCDRKQLWEEEQSLWENGDQDPQLDEFGDLYYETDHGNLFIHIPISHDIEEDLLASGFHVQKSILRSQLSKESKAVKEFSDNCRFWVAQKLAHVISDCGEKYCLST